MNIAHSTASNRYHHMQRSGARLQSLLNLIVKPLDWIAGRPAVALLLPGLLSLGLAWVYVERYGFPVPRVHDEFSYLLGADTFASGRVANPTHPLWVHFESPHIIHVPTYVSMYHPAQALVLAVGQRLAGHPWYGVLASVVVMCIAVGWMLRVWLPPRWALLGSFVAVQIAVFGHWSNMNGYWVASYWGGAVAATAGALVIGAAGRLRRRLTTGHSLLFAVGVAILANSRPYEGALLTIAALVLLAVSMRRSRVTVRDAMRKFILPAGIVLTIAGAGLMYYCWRTTGNPLQLPYQENVRQYISRRMFLWGEHQPKTYRHEALAKVYEYLMRSHLSYQRKLVDAVKRNFLFYFGPVLGLSLLLLFRVLKDQRVRPLLVFCVVVACGTLFLEWINIHYLAPVMGAFIAVAIQCLRHVAAFRPRGLPLGQMAALFILCAGFVYATADSYAIRGWHRSSWAMQRAQIHETLAADGDRHLVMVRYSESHIPTREWVYNAADIDNSTVIWAREMADNSELFDYYTGRRIWLLEADAAPPKIQPYPMK